MACSCSVVDAMVTHVNPGETGQQQRYAGQRHVRREGRQGRAQPEADDGSQQVRAGVVDQAYAQRSGHRTDAEHALLSPEAIASLRDSRHVLGGIGGGDGLPIRANISSCSGWCVVCWQRVVPGPSRPGSRATPGPLASVDPRWSNSP